MGGLGASRDAELCRRPSTTYLRAQTLAEPVRSRSLNLLIGYTRTAVDLSDHVPGSTEARRAAAREQLTERRLWRLAGEALASAPTASAPRLYVEALNEMIDNETARVAALSNRVHPGDRKPVGIRHQIPIHSRLQIASASRETTLNLVQTLAAFACLIQLSPSSPNAFAIFRSPVVEAAACAVIGYVNVCRVMPYEQQVENRKAAGTQLDPR
jgi:hypothetical protein